MIDEAAFRRLGQERLFVFNPHFYRALFNDIVEYAKTSHRNGRLLAHDTIARHALAELDAKLEVADLLYRRAIWLLENDKPVISEVSMFKMFMAETGQELVRTALDIIGLHGLWLERALEKAMVAKCAEMVGAGRKLLEMTAEYAKVRVQFGKPIGTLQAIQHHCANLATCVETAELITYRAGWMIEQGLRCRREVLQAKAWTNEACTRAAALGHQVHGGMGFTREYDLYLYSGRMRAFAQVLGGTAWCHERIAAEIGLGASD